MERIEGKKFVGETVIVDDKLFVGCLFENCKIIYYGGDEGWLNSTARNCDFRFEGAALRTIKYLKRLGIIPPDAPISASPPVSINIQ